MRVTFTRVVRSEWLKVRTLRLPVATLVALAAAPVALSFVRVAAALSAGDSDATIVLAECIGLAALPAGALAAGFGVVMGSADVVDGAAMTTYTVVPRRRWVVAARYLIAGTSTIGVATVSMLGAVGLAAAMLQGLSSAAIRWQPLLAAGANALIGVALLAITGVAIAAIARSTTGSATAAALVLIVLPLCLGITGREWLHPVTQLLPLPALQGAVHVPGATPFPLHGTLPSTLAPTAAVGAMTAWTLLTAGIALALTPVLPPLAHPARARWSRPSSRQSGVRSASALHRLSAANLLASERVRLLSTRGSRWFLGTSAALMPFVAGITAAGTTPPQLFSSPPSLSEIATASPTHLAAVLTSGLGTAQLPFAIVGALIVVSEHTTRSREGSLVAVPRPRALLAAKLLAALSVTVPVALLSSLAAALVAVPLVASTGFFIDDAGWIVAQSSVRAIVIVAAVTALGVGIGALVRAAVPAIALLSTLVLLAPTVFGQLQLLTRSTPWVIIANIGPLLPTAITAAAPPPSADTTVPLILQGGVLQFDANGSLTALVVWGAACCVLALVRSRRRTPE